MTVVDGRVIRDKPRHWDPTFVTRWLLRLALAALVGVALVVLAARLHDGPLGPIPGGALRSGPEVSEAIGDWSFAKEVGEIELQLASQSRSRTTWILVFGGQAYVPCSLGFPPGKKWHEQAVVDGRAILRIEGRRYPVTLTRLDDAEVQRMESTLRAEVARKYGQAPPTEAGVWVFRVTSRVPAS
jgi:hypothetical protein